MRSDGRIGGCGHDAESSALRCRQPRDLGRWYRRLHLRFEHQLRQAHMGTLYAVVRVARFMLVVGLSALSAEAAFAQQTAIGITLATDSVVLDQGTAPAGWLDLKVTVRVGNVGSSNVDRFSAADHLAVL